MTTVTDTLALRLGLSAKAIPSISLSALIHTLIAELGDPLSEKKLRRLSAKKLFSLLQESNSDIERGQCNHAFAILTHPTVSAMAAPEVDELPPLAGPKLKVAITSNSDRMLNAHFGSCLRMLVFEVNAQAFQLVDVRDISTHEQGLARTDYLTALIDDCHLLGTLSIGGPAAAKVTRADIHPIKQALPGPSEEMLSKVQTVLAGAPPKWIQKILDAQGDNT